jgi:hypothetical protein
MTMVALFQIEPGLPMTNEVNHRPPHFCDRLNLGNIDHAVDVSRTPVNLDRASVRASP